MTNIEKAKQLVRDRIPDLKKLSFGCGFQLSWEGCGTGMNYDDYPADERFIVWNTDDDNMTHYEIGDLSKDELYEAMNNNRGYAKDLEMMVEIIGHEPQLQHYMQVLKAKNIMHTLESDLLRIFEDEMDDKPSQIRFNLTTGQPATEEDAKKFISLVS